MRTTLAVEARQLGKWYEGNQGRVTALAGLDLSVPVGQFLCVLGPSGCGKTTLLRIFGGLETVSAGTLSLGEVPPGRPTQAMVFQGQSLLPWRRVRENVAYGLELRGVGRAERLAVVDPLIERVGLEAFAEAYPHELSEGMRQRANLARALAVDPLILLMDEPFANLDEQTRLRMQVELLRLWSAQTQTVLFVTHSVDEALVLADRIIVLSARPGRIIADLMVPFPRPRSLLALKGQTDYGELHRQLWQLLANNDIDPSIAATAPLATA